MCRHKRRTLTSSQSTEERQHTANTTPARTPTTHTGIGHRHRQHMPSRIGRSWLVRSVALTSVVYWWWQQQQQHSAFHTADHTQQHSCDRSAYAFLSDKINNVFGASVLAHDVVLWCFIVVIGWVGRGGWLEGFEEVQRHVTSTHIMLGSREQTHVFVCIVVCVFGLYDPLYQKRACDADVLVSYSLVLSLKNRKNDGTVASVVRKANIGDNRHVWRVITARRFVCFKRREGVQSCAANIGNAISPPHGPS